MTWDIVDFEGKDSNLCRTTTHIGPMPVTTMWDDTTKSWVLVEINAGCCPDCGRMNLLIRLPLKQAVELGWLLVSLDGVGG